MYRIAFAPTGFPDISYIPPALPRIPNSHTLDMLFYGGCISYFNSDVVYTVIPSPYSVAICVGYVSLTFILLRSYRPTLRLTYFRRVFVSDAVRLIGVLQVYGFYRRPIILVPCRGVAYGDSYSRFIASYLNLRIGRQLRISPRPALISESLVCYMYV